MINRLHRWDCPNGALKILKANPALCGHLHAKKNRHAKTILRCIQNKPLPLYDAALLELSEPILSTTAAPFVIHATGRAGDRVSVVSYGRGRDAALSWQRDCGVLWQNQGILAFDCSITFGTSGAPVFYRDGRRARILSLVSGGRVQNGEFTTAWGMELPSLVDQLKRDLRALPKPAASGARFESVGGLRGGNAGNRSGGAKFSTVGGS